jgi:hypothetical protein
MAKRRKTAKKTPDFLQNIESGGLHRQMGIPEGEGIPTAEIEKDLAKNRRSGNVKGARRDQLALNMRKFRHRGRKKKVG